jgi:hypothetical protein
LLLAADYQSYQGLWGYYHDNDLEAERQNYHSLQEYRWINKYPKMRGKYYSPDTDKLSALSHTTLEAEVINQTFYGQRETSRLTRQTLSLAIVHKDNRLKMSYFLGSKRCNRTVWGSRDLASGVNAGQSRINLP